MAVGDAATHNNTEAQSTISALPQSFTTSPTIRSCQIAPKHIARKDNQSQQQIIPPFDRTLNVPGNVPSQHYNPAQMSTKDSPTNLHYSTQSESRSSSKWWHQALIADVVANEDPNAPLMSALMESLYGSDEASNEYDQNKPETQGTNVYDSPIYDQPRGIERFGPNNTSIQELDSDSANHEPQLEKSQPLMFSSPTEYGGNYDVISNDNAIEQLFQQVGPALWPEQASAQQFQVLQNTSQYTEHVPTQRQMQGNQPMLQNRPIYRKPVQQQVDKSLVLTRLRHNNLAQSMRQVSGGPVQSSLQVAQPLNVFNTGFPTSTAREMLQHARRAQEIGIDNIMSGELVTPPYPQVSPSPGTLSTRPSIKLGGMTPAEQIEFLKEQIRQIESNSADGDSPCLIRQKSRLQKKSIVRDGPIRETINRLSIPRRDFQVLNTAQQAMISPSMLQITTSMVESAHFENHYALDSSYQSTPHMFAPCIPQAQQLPTLLPYPSPHELNPRLARDLGLSANDSQKYCVTDKQTVSHLAAAINEPQYTQFENPSTQWLRQNDVFSTPNHQYDSLQLQHLEQWVAWKSQRNSMSSITNNDLLAPPGQVESWIRDPQLVSNLGTHTGTGSDFLEQYQFDTNSNIFRESENAAFAADMIKCNCDLMHPDFAEFIDWDQLFKESEQSFQSTVAPRKESKVNSARRASSQQSQQVSENPELTALLASDTPWPANHLANLSNEGLNQMSSAVLDTDHSP